MEVPLHLVLVTLLALSQTNGANTNRTRLTSISSSSLSTPFPSIKNTSEINNRDLNKITTDNPKTDLLESKLESIIDKIPHHDNVPLILSNHTKIKETNDTNEKFPSKIPKEKHREENGKAINEAAESIWSEEYDGKNLVYTLPPVSSDDPGKFSSSDEIKDFLNFDTKFNAITTPKTELFDKKFKETVDSVDQGLEEIERNHADELVSHFNDEEDKDDNDFHILKDMPTIKSHPEYNHTMEAYSTKMIVNNETMSDKNWIRKNLNVERIKKVHYESTYNDTASYGDESTVKIDVSTENIFSTLAPVSQKPFLRKEPNGDKLHSHILSNKIETDSSEPIKVVVSSTTTPVSTTKNYTENPTENVSKVPSSSTQKSTTSRTHYVSDSENQVIPETPLPFLTKNTMTHQEKEKMVPEVTVIESTTLSSINISSTISISETSTSTDSTTDLSGTMDNGTKPTEEISTEISTQSWEITTVDFYKTTIIQNDFENVTVPVTEEISTKIETVPVENTTEPVQRTSKSLNNFINPEEMHRELELTTIIPITTTLKYQSDITSTDGEIDDREVSSTTTEVPTTTFNLDDVEVVTTEVPTTAQPTTTITAQPTSLPSVLPTDPSSSNETTINRIEANERSHTTLSSEYFINTHLSSSTQPSTVAAASDVVSVHVPKHNDSTIMDSSTRMNKVYIPTRRQPSRDRSEIKSTTQNLLLPGITTIEDSSESVPTEDSYTKDNEEGNGGKIAAIVISSVGAVCLVALAGLLYVMKKRQKRLNYGPRCRPVSLDDYSIDNLSVYNSVMRKGGNRLSKRSFGNPAFEDPTGPTHPLNFPALAKFSTNFEDIKAEYEEIPQISAKTSELPEGCETKNRYANVIPLPETRVFLKSIEGYPNSDYINANYVTGAKNVRKYYIAAQGPMQNTVDDFWRMIWEQNVKVILMLTHLIENGFEKCVDYLPESEVINCNRSFGDFQITLKRREVKEKYIISILQLKNMVSNSWREVTHFWYLGWPEKGVPSEANSLIAFLIEARSYMKTNTLDKKDTMNGTNIQNGNRQAMEFNPVVVHCSPGTGRSGVAIACDIAIREFETSRLVDIPKIVYRMRRDRAGAVQTREQYQFIYKVVSLYATKLTGGALENF